MASIPFPLEPGERVIWQARASGVTGYGQLVVMVVALSAVFGGLGLLGLPLVFMSDIPIGAAIGQLFSNLLCASPLLVFTGFWLAPRLRESYWLSDRALVQRKLLGGFERVPLASVRGAERYVAVYTGRYGRRQEVVTDRANVVLEGGRSVLFGPSKDIERVLDLVQYGVLGSYVDLAMLPSITGDPAPAETRTDIFLCASTQTDGDRYGPLFVGPTRVVRVTEEMSAHLLGHLYTELGRALEGDDAEAHLVHTLKNPSVGHYVEVPRQGTRLDLDRNRLVVRAQSGAEHTIDLAGADADRLRTFLARRT